MPLTSLQVDIHNSVVATSVLVIFGVCVTSTLCSQSLMPHSQSLNILSRTSSMESLASALQDEAEQVSMTTLCSGGI